MELRSERANHVTKAGQQPPRDIGHYAKKGMAIGAGLGAAKGVVPFAATAAPAFRVLRRKGFSKKSIVLAMLVGGATNLGRGAVRGGIMGTGIGAGYGLWKNRKKK
jgi:hypothetical protein